MKLKSIIIVILSIVAICSCEFNGDVIEERGKKKKKKKIALFVYWADIIIKKIFVLKLIYAFVFFVVIHKAGYFLSWFISYLKEQKKDHYKHHYDSHHYDWSPGSYVASGSYEPYRRKAHGV